MTPEEQAKQKLEEYRSSKVDIWMNDFGELSRYREANAALGQTSTAECRVVFMGDSITDFWRLEEFFPGKAYLNRGIAGQTTPQMLIRFRPDVIDLKPSAVMILAGTNDIAGNTGPMRIEDIESNLASMAELSRLHGIRVVLASVLPVHDHTPDAKVRLIGRPPQKILELNQWMKDYCENTGCVYLDYFSVMVDHDGLLKQSMADDGLHPSPAGYRAMAPLAQGAIERVLAND